MKNDYKRRVTALYAGPNLPVTSSADMQKLELETEITKVEQMLSHEYLTASRGSERMKELNWEEEKKLKKELNCIVTENRVREKKIKGLQDLIKCYSIVSPRSGSTVTSIVSNANEEDGVEGLKRQIEEENEKIGEEEANGEILI
jgi:hypothetical protein